jgi:hypothetical protein
MESGVRDRTCPRGWVTVLPKPNRWQPALAAAGGYPVHLSRKWLRHFAQVANLCHKGSPRTGGQSAELRHVLETLDPVGQVGNLPEPPQAATNTPYAPCARSQAGAGVTSPVSV